MSHYLIIPVMCLLCLCTADGEGLTGPDFLVTNLNGTRELNLTCQAPDPSLVNRYGWSTPGDATERCNTTLAPNVCTFEPMLEDDNRNVTCIALNSKGGILARGFYTVNLKYPPPHPPSLFPTEQLKQGDVITCTVTGGKPRVTNVTFYCQHPGHADREDDVSDDGRAVSSTITVNVSETTDVNVTCTCSAYWAPEPRLYSHVLNRTVTLKYHQAGNKQHQSIASGAGVGAMVFVAFIVITCVT